ncbi:antA/AntB antirepressor family protein [Solidesulfovibrio sp.]
MADKPINDANDAGKLASTPELVYIPVTPGSIAGRAMPTVNARELHAFLEVETKFADWITRRIDEYGFIEDQDYIRTVLKTGKRSNVTQIDYHLTIDTAKELSMVEKNERGRQARRYFIDCERRTREGGPVRPAAPGSSPQAKFTNEQLVALLRQGRTQAQAATILGVGEAAVSKRLRLLNENQIIQGIRAAEVPAPAALELPLQHPAEDWLDSVKGYLMLADHSALFFRDMEVALDKLTIGRDTDSQVKSMAYALKAIAGRCSHYLSEFHGSLEQVRDVTQAAIKKAARGPRLLAPQEQAERTAKAQKAAHARWDKERALKNAVPPQDKARKAQSDKTRVPA